MPDFANEREHIRYPFADNGSGILDRVFVDALISTPFGAGVFDASHAQIPRARLASLELLPNSNVRIGIWLSWASDTFYIDVPMTSKFKYVKDLSLSDLVVVAGVGYWDYGWDFDWGWKTPNLIQPFTDSVRMRISGDQGWDSVSMHVAGLESMIAVSATGLSLGAYDKRQDYRGGLTRFWGWLYVKDPDTGDLVVGSNYDTAFTAVEFVVATDAFEAYVSENPDIGFGTELEFAAAAVVPQQSGPLSFAVSTDPETDAGTWGPMRTYMKLVEGSNISISESEGGDGETVITVAAVPGAGKGLVPCSEIHSTEVHRPVMGLVPDTYGDIVLKTGSERCYNLVPTLDAVNDKVTFQLQSVCQACCDCDDYSDIAKAVMRMLTRSKTILDDLNSARNSGNGYEAGVTRYNSEIAPKYSRPSFKVYGTAGGDGSDDTSKLATLTLWLRNLSGRANAPKLIPDRIVVSVTTPVSGVSYLRANWQAQGDADIGAAVKKGGRLDAASTLDLSVDVPGLDSGVKLAVYMRMEAEAAVETTWVGNAKFFYAYADAPLVEHSLSAEFEF